MDARLYTAKLMGPVVKLNRFSGTYLPQPKPGKRTGTAEERLSQSLCRTRARILELALCNKWQYFFTGTFAPANFDRYDLQACYKIFTQSIRDLNRHRAEPIRYMFVPERHKDGAWHVHGFLMGLQEYDVKPFDLSCPLPARLRTGMCFNWPFFASHFGFCDLEPIRDFKACCFYTTKYITKDLVRDVNTHIYRASVGLARAIDFGSFVADADTFHFDVEGQYCSVTYEDASFDFIVCLLNFLPVQQLPPSPFSVPEVEDALEFQLPIAGWCNW